MTQLTCPNCGKPFSVSESDYAALLGQVKNHEFEAELNRRIQELHAAWLAEQKAAKSEDDRQHEAALQKKELEIHSKEAQILGLQEQLNRIQQDNQKDLELALSKQKQQLADELNSQKLEIAKLKSEADQNQASLKLEYEGRLKMAQELVEHYKNMKSVMSTKMLGETLEIHCAELYDQRIRRFLPKADFGKDNDASSGSKGDFIFRDYVNDDEFISIMFEMKNEAEQTEKKHKNSDFFDKLDKDRRQKNCKYAVLVSTLEADSDLYNEGIVDVSHIHENMFVVRPQFFITIIQQLRAIALSAYQYEQQLVVERSKNVDVTNFESKLSDFKEKFGRNVRLASDKFNKAIDEINKTIKHLEEVRDNLTGSKKYLELANGNTEGLTIKKLTRGNDTMKKLFAEAADAEAADETESTESAENE